MVVRYLHEKTDEVEEYVVELLLITDDSLEEVEVLELVYFSNEFELVVDSFYLDLLKDLVDSHTQIKLFGLAADISI